MQAEDPTLCKVREFIEQDRLLGLAARRTLALPVKRLLSHWKKLKLYDGVMCRDVQDS